MSGVGESRVAIVTGSTKGIGRGIAEELAGQGVRTIITSRDKQRARDVAEEIKTSGSEALGLQFDIERTEDCLDLISDTLEAFGRLDILVNNALSQRCVLPLDTLSDDQIRGALAENIANTFLLCRSAYPYLRKTRGVVINVGSVVINQHLLGLPIYAIVKAAVLQMTKVLAAEWAEDRVRVNAINPGFIRTSAFSDLGMPEDLVEKSYDFYKAYVPLREIGQPKDVGILAVYLASDNARLITGTVIDIDAGYSVRGLPLYEPF
jgi:NAD(P)-dependent dehydrogenase (short-subunit alcohol dehydrogenase family)